MPQLMGPGQADGVREDVKRIVGAHQFPGEVRFPTNTFYSSQARLVVHMNSTR